MNDDEFRFGFGEDPDEDETQDAAFTDPVKEDEDDRAYYTLSDGFDYDPYPREPEDEPVGESEEEPVGESEEEPVGESEEEPVGESEEEPVEESEEEPEDEPVEESEEEPEDEPVEESEEEPEDEIDDEIEDEPEEGSEEKDDPNGEEARPISADLIRGHINTIILRSLYDGDKYGYEILEEIERKSHKQYSLKQPSLYSALKRLEKDGYITSYWGGSVGGGRRKYFSLTDEGKTVAERNQTEWEYSRTVIDSLISDKDFDLDRPAPAAVDMRALRNSTSRVPSREEEGEYEYDEPYGGSEEESEAISSERAALEAERARLEEMLKEREEVLRAREEAGTRREQELLEREFALQAEEARREEERAREEAAAIERERLAEEERIRAAEEAAEQERLQEEARLAEEERVRAEEEAAERERLQEEERIRAAEEAQQREAEEAIRLAEEAKLRLEEERARKEAEEEKLRAEAEELERKQAEEARLRAEAERAAIQAGIDEVERARALALNSEKGDQNARIVEMEPFTEERAQYEKLLRDQKAELEAYHAQQLAEQEQRIREEDAEHYRQREQQMIHQNYLSLVNGLRNENGEEAPRSGYGYYYGEPQTPRKDDTESYVYVNKPEAEREYRSIIRKLYSSAIKGETEEAEPEPAPTPVPAPAPVRTRPEPEPARYRREAQPEPAPAPAPRRREEEEAPAPRKSSKEKAAPRAARSLDGIDFYDLETRAAQDGIRISISGGRKKEPEHRSDALVHKGRALFFSALVVFLLCIAEGAVCLGLQNMLDLPRFYPYFIWGTGLILLLVTAILYLNRYGERALRQAGNLLANAILSYALCVIVILIVALASNIDFTNPGALMTFVILPAIYFFSIIVFSVVYYLQIHPNRED